MDLGRIYDVTLTGNSIMQYACITPSEPLYKWQFIIMQALRFGENDSCIWKTNLLHILQKNHGHDGHISRILHATEFIKCMLISTKSQ